MVCTLFSETLSHLLYMQVSDLDEECVAAMTKYYCVTSKEIEEKVKKV